MRCIRGCALLEKQCTSHCFSNMGIQTELVILILGMCNYNSFSEYKTIPK
jgi:hypothetical protein